MDQMLARAVELITTSRKAIAFTGAGVSTESGIPDFRSAAGLWARFDPAEYATLGAFKADPEKVWHMLAEMEQVLQVQPNAGHQAMADLEAGGVLHGIITQNVDGLHQAAGSRRVVEFHGSSRTFTCLTCGAGYPREQVRAMATPPRCIHTIPDNGGLCGAVLKPDVVFFDEMIPPQALAGAWELVQEADVVIVAGTSCEVYPAAEIPHRVRAQGGTIIEINREPVASLRADVSLVGNFSEMASALHTHWRGRMG